MVTVVVMVVVMVVAVVTMIAKAVNKELISLRDFSVNL